MRFHWFVVSCGLLLGPTFGCSNGANSTPAQLPTSTVKVTFTGSTPTAIAIRIGDAAFEPAALQSGNLILTLPFGAEKYTIAYVCQESGGNGYEIAFVIEAALQDGTAYTVSCDEFQRPSVPATFQVDASAFPGTSGVFIVGKGGASGGGNFPGGFASPGQVGAQLLEGTQDIAIVTIPGMGVYSAVRILRSQTPEAVSGSNVVFNKSDATTPQTLTLSNLPTGFSLNRGGVGYVTASGTSIPVDQCCGPPPFQYAAVPAAAVASGDFYRYDWVYNDAQNRLVGIADTTTNGPIGQVLPLPQPWTYSGPAAATLPTFTFDYSGFPVIAAEYAQISWQVFTSPGIASNFVTVLATANFQSGATTITIPDLTNLPGFFPLANSRNPVDWGATIFGGTMPGFSVFPGGHSRFGSSILPVTLPNVPPNGSIQFVQTGGFYNQP